MRTGWVNGAVMLAVGVVLVLLAGMLPGVLAPIGYVAGVILIVVGVVLLIAWAIHRGP